MDAEQRGSKAIETMRSAGLRITRPRHLIVKVLAGCDRHLTAEGVHAMLTAAGEKLDLATVHRTMATLIDLGLAHTVSTPRAAVFGLTDHPHAHALCQSCGATADAARLDASTRVPAGFRIEGVIYQGTCDRCRTTCPPKRAAAAGAA